MPDVVQAMNVQCQEHTFLEWDTIHTPCTGPAGTLYKDELRCSTTGSSTVNGSLVLVVGHEITADVHK